MSFRTALGRARGLGSAKDGVGHWWGQRVSALALIPLCLWFAVSVLTLVHADYGTAQAWVHIPWVAVLLVLLLAAVFYHAYLGVQVVVEDYMQGEALKLASLLAIKFLCVLLAAGGIFAVLRIALGGRP